MTKTESTPKRYGFLVISDDPETKQRLFNLDDSIVIELDDDQLNRTEPIVDPESFTETNQPQRSDYRTATVTEKGSGKSVEITYRTEADLFFQIGIKFEFTDDYVDEYRSGDTNLRFEDYVETEANNFTYTPPILRSYRILDLYQTAIDEGFNFPFTLTLDDLQGFFAEPITLNALRYFGITYDQTNNLVNVPLGTSIPASLDIVQRYELHHDDDTAYDSLLVIDTLAQSYDNTVVPDSSSDDTIFDYAGSYVSAILELIKHTNEQ